MKYFMRNVKWQINVYLTMIRKLKCATETTIYNWKYCLRNIKDSWRISWEIDENVGTKIIKLESDVHPYLMDSFLAPKYLSTDFHFNQLRIICITLRNVTQTDKPGCRWKHDPRQTGNENTCHVNILLPPIGQTSGQRASLIRQKCETYGNWPTAS